MQFLEGGSTVDFASKLWVRSLYHFYICFSFYLTAVPVGTSTQSLHYIVWRLIKVILYSSSSIIGAWQWFLICAKPGSSAVQDLLHDLKYKIPINPWNSSHFEIVNNIIYVSLCRESHEPLQSPFSWHASVAWNLTFRNSFLTLVMLSKSSWPHRYIFVKFESYIQHTSGMQLHRCISSPLGLSKNFRSKFTMPSLCDESFPLTSSPKSKVQHQYYFSQEQA